MSFARNVLFGLAAATLAACSSPEPEPVEVSDTVELSAIVQSVDQETRQVLLRGDNGALATIVAGPEVVNLPQLEPGDRVVAIYERSVAVQMAPAGMSKTTDAAMVSATAPEGSKPAGVAAQEVRTVVTIVNYDQTTRIVTFIDPDGFTHAVRVEKPEMQAFASSFNAGDRVEVVFTEAVAIGVEEVTG